MSYKFNSSSEPDSLLQAEDKEFPSVGKEHPKETLNKAKF